MNLGDTFIWRPPRVGREHLYIVISDPAKNLGKFVIVNITESLHGQKSMVLARGDHPYISKDSDVNFGDAIITDEQTIQHEIKHERARPHAPMKLEIVERIALTALDHPAVEFGIQKFLAREWKKSA
jgi:hypothetical protein